MKTWQKVLSGLLLVGGGVLAALPEPRLQTAGIIATQVGRAIAETASGLTQAPAPIEERSFEQRKE